MIEYQIFTNSDCNLRCSYCFQHEKPARVNAPEQCADYLRACYRRDYAERHKSLSEGAVVYAIGGEPFLHSGLLECIAEQARTLDGDFGVTAPFTLQIVTNGTLFGRPEVRRFMERWKEHLRITFSIDGCKEAHDRHRVDMLGRGSFDSVVEGVKYVQRLLSADHYYCVSTVSHETLPYLGQSFITLAQLGFNRIKAHPVFEEEWTACDAVKVAGQFSIAADWLIEKNLLERVHIRDLNYFGANLTTFEPRCELRHNFCNPGKDLCCLGLDGLLYGCFKLLSVKRPQPIGRIENGRLFFEPDGLRLADEIAGQYSRLPEKCRGCAINGFCRRCPVYPYLWNQENPSEYLQKRAHCGWTHGTVLARTRLRDRLLKNA